MTKKRLNVQIDAELLEAAKAKAERLDLSLSQVVRRLLRQWVKEDTQQGYSTRE